MIDKLMSGSSLEGEAFKKPQNSDSIRLSTSNLVAISSSELCFPKAYILTKISPLYSNELTSVLAKVNLQQ